MIPQNFQVQLGPFVTEIEKRGSASFKWTQGTIEATPPEGFKDYFGAGPLWRFIDYDGSEAFDILDSIREIPTGENAEATMRLLMDDQPTYGLSSVQRAIRNLFDQIDADPEIEVCFPELSSPSITPPIAVIATDRRRTLELTVYHPAGNSGIL